VVATNALELGIDVGGLDAVVLAGYPGTIAATRQRGGRAGRRQEPSLTVLVARNTPIDQFLARHPSFLLEASPEQALVHPDNVDILLNHLRCAVFELPFAPGGCFGDLSAEDTAASLDFLSDKGVARGRNGHHFVGSSYPAAEVSLRNTAGDEVVVFNSDTQEPVAKVPPHSARFELHEGAIYQHDGETYEVTRFDVGENRAFIRPVEPVYYTVAVDQTNVDILSTRDEQAAPMALRGLGDVQVVEHMVGFKKVKFRSHENLGFGEIRLPPLTLDTEGTWMDIDSAVTASLTPEEMSFALEGLSHGLAQVASLRLMCDPNDIATAVQMDCGEEGRAEAGRPPRARIVLYDAHAGGVGLSGRAFEEMNILLADCLSLLRGCPCPSGCPACTGPLADIGLNAKTSAIALAALLAGEAQVRH